MHRSRFHLPFLTTGLLVAALLLGAGCGGDDSTTPEIPAETLLVTGTIDEEGGELIHSEVVLTIPAGALGESVDLSLYRENSGHPSGEDDQPVYRVVGLPGELQSPVTLRIQHSLVLDEGDSSFMFLGEEREATSGGSGLSWFPSTSRDSSGWCITELIRGALALGDKDPAEVQAAVAQDVTVVSSIHNHFEVYYLESQVTAVSASNALNDFDTIWSTLDHWGWQFGANDTIWPLKVIIVPPANSFACYVTAPMGKGYFQIDPRFLQPDIILLPVVAHEMLHCAQTFYDPRPPEQWGTLNQERLWLDEATAAWFEVFTNSNEDVSPLGMDLDNYTSPLAGISGRPYTPMAEYGYGMAGFIKYMVEDPFAGQGEDRILELFQEFASNGDVTDAIDEMVDPEVAQWCVDMQRQLVEGNLYPLDPHGEVWEHWPIDVFFSGEIGVQESTSVSVPDLGAGIVKLLMDGDEPPSLTSLVITTEVGEPDKTTEPLTLTIYGRPLDSIPVRLAAGTDSVSVEGWQDIYQEYEDILVMVSRPFSSKPGHTGQVEVSVKAKVIVDLSVIDVTALNHVSLEVRTDNMYNSGYLAFNDRIGIYGYVSWQGNGFVSSTTSDTFNIAFNLDNFTVGEWSGRERYETIGGNFIVKRLSGHSLPLLDWDETGLTFRISGEVTCNTLTGVFYSIASDEETPPYRYTTGNSCHEGESAWDRSSIYLRLSRIDH